MNRTLYLNNTGSRWINTDKKNMQCILIHKAKNYKKVRQVEFFESFGNFVSYNLKYQGKRISVFADGIDEKSGLPICYADYKENYPSIKELLK